MPSVAWCEFLCGPVTEQEIVLVRSLLSGGVIAFEEAQAAAAARLFNAVGRVRSLRVDAMVAACAIEAGYRLATSNRSDFIRFAEPSLAKGCRLGRDGIGSRAAGDVPSVGAPGPAQDGTPPAFGVRRSRPSRPGDAPPGDDSTAFGLTPDADLQDCPESKHGGGR